MEAVEYGEEAAADNVGLGDNNQQGISEPTDNGNNAENDASGQGGEERPKFNKVCPSVLKGEPCWALSRGKPCHYAKHDRDGSGGGGSHPANYPPVSSNVYVCHLPLSMTKDQLYSMFSPYGNVRECKLLVEPRTQEPKGVGFIHFSNPQEAKSAIEGIHGLVITGSEKALECRMAKPNPKSRDSSERGRGGFRGPPRGPPRDEYGPPRGPPRDYGRPYDDYPPPRGYGEYGRRPPPPYEEDYEYGPMRRGGPPGGPRPLPYGRPEPRRGPPPPRGGDYEAYGPPPPRMAREEYDPYLETEYYGGGPAFPPRGGAPGGGGGGYGASRPELVTLPPVMGPPIRR